MSNGTTCPAELPLESAYKKTRQMNWAWVGNRQCSVAVELKYKLDIIIIEYHSVIIIIIIIIIVTQFA